MKKFLILISLIILYVSSFGQKLSTPYVDKKTYQYYLNGQWDSLIYLANKAIKQGIDFYYLRTRLGIAYYNKKQYRLAAIHFQKAINQYKDKIILEYLYYSYLFGGQTADAYKLIYDMPIDLRNKVLKNPRRNLQNFSVYFSNLSVPNADQLRFTDLDGQYNIKGEQVINYGYFLPTITATWRHFTGLKYIALSYYAYDNLYRLQENNGSIEENPQYLRQTQFSYTFVDAKNEKIDLLWNFSTLIGSVTRTSEITITRGRMFSGRAIVTQRTPIFDFSGSIGAKIKKPYADLTAYLSAQLFSYKPNFQITINPTFYPKANLNLYLSPSLILKQDLSQTQYLTSLTAGIGIKNKIWFEPQIWLGNISYFNYNLGTIIYNDDEVIKAKYGLNLYLTLKNKLIYLSYNYFNKIRYITIQTPTSEIKQPYSYNSNLFTLGITFYVN